MTLFGLPWAAMPTADAQEASGADLVISQVYGGGGNAGALYTHDLIEVFNRGGSAIDLAGWSVQYASATGTSWQVTPLAGTLQPGQYLLVQQAAGAGGTEPLPTPDVTGSIAMAAANGKVALVDDDTALSGSCPLDDVVDFVGYGTANCFEGTAATPATSNPTSAVPAGAGCIDTDDNAADFSIINPPTPRNSASPLNVCEPVDNEPIVPSCVGLTIDEGIGGSVSLSATDADGTVVSAAITSEPVEGIALANLVPAGEVGGMLTVDLTVTDTVAVGAYEVEVTFTNDDDEPQTASCVVDVVVQADLCEIPVEDVTLINEIQGDGAATPIPGVEVVTRGVVTADFTSGGVSGLPNNQGLRGFFIEAITADRDEDLLTSEGLFVFEPAGTFAGEIGDLVHVEGVAGESFEVTQVTADRVVVCADTGVDTELPPPVELPLPVAPADRAEVLEPLESMRVTHPELTVVEFFQLERFGEVRLSSGGVLQNPTNVVDPYDDEAYEAIVAFNRANNIILDDGRSGQNLNRLPLGEVDPLPYVEPGDALRIGDQLRDHPAVLHYAFNAWRLQPVDIDAITQEFQANRTRPRPQTPPDVGGSLTIASYNVLNYFDGDGQGGGFPTARGAVTASELERQTAKLVDAVKRIDADVVGLIEIENDGGEFQATATFVDALNEAYGAEVYDFVDTGVVGTDAIKMAFIYKPATVEATGDHAILDSSVDPRFEDTRSRPVIAQTFTELASGEAVTVAVNHLKSKGSACDPEDNDPRQGNCNGVRLRAAEAMADWLATNPTGEAAVGNLIIGDLNAYAKEDPIVALQDAGYTDLLDAFAPEGVMPYTYTFDATQGYLDHALADADVLPFVTGTAAWNINADEVPALDYQESVFLPGGSSRFRTAEVAEAYFIPDAFRSSDHDPVIVGLEFPAENQDPVVEDLALETEQDTAVSGQIIASDPDGDPITFAYGEPANGTVVATDDTGAFTYTPDAGFVGVDTFTVTASDDRGGEATATVTITVTEVEPPVDEFLTCPDEGPSFPDVSPTSVHADNVSCGAALGLLLGTDDGRFVPAGNLTRGQAASILDRIATETNRPVPGPGQNFPDVAPGNVHADAIGRLAAAGIIKGFSDGTFGPNLPITRAQLNSLVVRFIEEQTGQVLVLGAPFADVPTESVHSDALRKARAAGISLGDEQGNANPNLSIRRDQAASLFVRSLGWIPIASLPS